MAPSGPPLSLADVPFVLQCLRAALATTGEGQKQAEAHLQSLEDRPGFCSCLAVRSSPAGGGPHTIDPPPPDRAAAPVQQGRRDACGASHHA